MALTTAALVLTGVSGALGFVGQMQAASAQEAQYDYERQVAERNQILAQQDREQAIRTSQIEAEELRSKNRRKLSSIRAAYGSSGLELSGSPLEVLSDSAIEMALDERRVEYEGEVTAREGAIRILGLQDDANAARASASNASKAGVIGGVTSLVNAGTNIAKLGADE